MSVDVDDLFGGGLGDFSEFFRNIFGGAPTSSSRGRPAQRSRPKAAEYPVTISFWEAFQGASRRIEIDGRRLEVKIPAGARTGTRVRVADAVVTPSGQKSDLHLVIEVSDDPRFERQGDDLYTDIEVDLYQAVLGGEAKVATPGGSVVLTIPAGTQPGQTFRLAGQGMPRVKNPQNRGDLFARVKVKIRAISLRNNARCLRNCRNQAEPTVNKCQLHKLQPSTPTGLRLPGREAPTNFHPIGGKHVN